MDTNEKNPKLNESRLRGCEHQPLDPGSGP